MSQESGFIDLKDMSRSERETSSASSIGMTFDDILDKVRSYVRERGIMLEDTFHEYDPRREGHISASDFRKACKEAFQDILTDDQVQEIQSHYCGMDNPNCCDWSKFLHDAESLRTSKGTTADNHDSESSKDLQKKVVLKRVAQSLEGRTDITSLLEQASSQDSSRNKIDGEASDTRSEQLFQLLSEVAQKDDLKVIGEIYTDGMGFKYQEFVCDLKESLLFSHDTEDSGVKTHRTDSRKNKVSPSLTAFSLEIPEHQTWSSPKNASSDIRRNRRRFSISYETLVWIVFLAVTVLCVVDHFVLKGDVVLKRGGKLPRRIWGTNIGETVTNIVWAVTARLIITSQNLMFYTMLWCFPNFISEVAPRWITIDGIRDVHVRIHRFAGIFLIAIPSLAHVLVIFLPPLVDGTALKYYPPSTFNYSSYSDHLNWSKFWDPAAVQDWTFNDHTGVHLTSDELYRFALMIVLFCIFFPLSRSNYANQRSYSLAMTLHVIAGIWYAIDNIRKITHGLAHVFNLPMLIIWCLDRVLSIWVYRHHHARIVQKKVIGNNEYVVLYLKLDSHVKYAVGDVYYLHHNVKESSGIVPQRSHPFTTFANSSPDSTWDIGVVVSIMEDEEQLFLPWTSWLAKDHTALTLHTWGPYRSSVWQLYNQFTQDSDVMQPSSHYLLFATGSGCGYVLDVLSCLAHGTQHFPKRGSQNCKRDKIEIFYSVRCKAFYDFFRKPIDDLLKKIKEKDIADVNFQFYVTSPEDLENEVDTADTQIQLISGRIDFEKALQSAKKSSRCYFVGRPAIAESVEKICKRRGIGLVKDYTNGREGEEDRRLLMKYLKIGFWVTLFVVAICVITGLVIDLRYIKSSLRPHGSNVTGSSM